MVRTKNVKISQWTFTYIITISFYFFYCIFRICCEISISFIIILRIQNQRSVPVFQTGGTLRSIFLFLRQMLIPLSVFPVPFSEAAKKQADRSVQTPANRTPSQGPWAAACPGTYGRSAARRECAPARWQRYYAETKGPIFLRRRNSH